LPNPQMLHFRTDLDNTDDTSPEIKLNHVLKKNWHTVTSIIKY